MRECVCLYSFFKNVQALNRYSRNSAFTLCHQTALLYWRYGVQTCEGLEKLLTHSLNICYDLQAQNDRKISPFVRRIYSRSMLSRKMFERTKICWAEPL